MKTVTSRSALKISVVIPCRKGSTRCKNKNLRKFGNTTLLENKIQMLKKSIYISEIIVSSNDQEALDIAKQCGVTGFKRSNDLCHGDVPPAKVHESLAKCASNEVFVYASPVAPFMSVEKFDEIIKFWIDNPQHEVVSAGCSIKNFIWKDFVLTLYIKNSIQYSSNIVLYRIGRVYQLCQMILLVNRLHSITTNQKAIDMIHLYLNIFITMNPFRMR